MHKRVHRSMLPLPAGQGRQRIKVEHECTCNSLQIVNPRCSECILWLASMWLTLTGFHLDVQTAAAALSCQQQLVVTLSVAASTSLATSTLRFSVPCVGR